MPPPPTAYRDRLLSSSSITSDRPTASLSPITSFSSSSSTTENDTPSSAQEPITRTSFFGFLNRRNPSPSRKQRPAIDGGSSPSAPVSRASSFKQHRSVPVQIPPTFLQSPATPKLDPSQPKRTFLSAEESALGRRGELLEGLTPQELVQDLWLGCSRIFGTGIFGENALSPPFSFPMELDPFEARGTGGLGKETATSVRVDDAKKMEKYARVLAKRILQAKVITNLFPLFVSLDRPAPTTSASPTTNIPSNILIDCLLKIIITFCQGSYPLALRLSGFALLHALLSTSPPSYLSPSTLASLLRVILSRPSGSKPSQSQGPLSTSFSVEESELKVSCVRALLLGGKAESREGLAGEQSKISSKNKEGEYLSRDGWDWSEIVGGLKIWAEELGVAWSLELVIGGTGPGASWDGQSLGLGLASTLGPGKHVNDAKRESERSTRPARPIPSAPSALQTALVNTLDLLSFIIHKKGSLLSPESGSLPILMALFGQLAWQGLYISSGVQASLLAIPLPERTRRRRTSEYERTVALATGEEKEDGGTVTTPVATLQTTPTQGSPINTSPINPFPSRGRAGFANSATHRESPPSAHTASTAGHRVPPSDQPPQPSTQTRVSRSPSVSIKAPSTTSTSASFAKSYSATGLTRPPSNVIPAQAGPTTAFSPPAASLPLPSLTSAAVLSSAVSSSNSNAGGGAGERSNYASSSVTSIFPQPTLAPIHPLVKTLLRLFSTLIRKLPHMLSDDILVPASRIGFAMLTIGGETEDESWKVLRELFGKGFGGRFGGVLEGVLKGSMRGGEGWDEPEDSEAAVVRGAVRCIRSALKEAYAYRKAQASSTTTVGSSDVPESASSFHAPAAPTSSSLPLANLDLSSFSTRLMSAMAVERHKKGSDEARERWVGVDTEVLLVLDDVLESAADKGMDKDLGEGDLIVEILAKAKGWVERFRYPDGKPFTLVREMELTDASKLLDSPDILNLFARLCRILPRRLVTYVSHDRSGSSAPFIRLPRTLASLSLDLSLNVSQAITLLVVDHYRTEDLCIPTCAAWLDNLHRLSQAVFISQPQAARDFPEARKDMAKLLLKEVYGRIKDVAEDRHAFLERVVLPLLEVTLEKEKDETIEKAAWAVLVNAAVSETLEKEDEVDERLSGADEQEEGEEIGENETKTTGELFDRIRRLMSKVACLASASALSLGSRPASMFSPTSRFMDPVGLTSPVLSPEGSIGDISSLPSFSLLPAFSSSGTSTPVSGLDSQQPTDRTNTPIKITTSPGSPPTTKSLNACLALIATFTKITFRPHTSLLPQPSRVEQTVRSSRSIALFNNVLDLLRPHLGSSQSSSRAAPTSAAQTTSPRRPSDPPQPNFHASCPRARLVLLQWLLHLRADTRHRLLVTNTIDASYAAFLLGRSSQASERSPAPDPTETTRRGRPGKFAAQTEANERNERGRNSTRDRDRSRPGNASRSRSRLPELGSSRDIIQTPLWFYGESPAFELPNTSIGSFGLNTFDPQRRTSPEHDQTLFPMGIWLPVSEYLKVLIEILSDEREWELVSYLLCYLPAQLSNQHFFCGPRAKEQLGKLLDNLCGWLGPGGSLPISRNLPVGVRKADLQAVAYQSLDVLISYHRQFVSLQHSALIRAFHAGVSATGSTESTGKACIHALTMAADELVLPLAKELPGILFTLSTLTSNVSLSIHILEFIYCVSHNKRLYSNFTPQQYELVFAVILNIITTHHESVTESPGEAATAAQRTAAILSQHMLQLAYFIIYPWFLALPASQRPRFIPFITKKLIQAKRSPLDRDTRSEVCIDFLHRYTYSNADPKPAPSFLAELVLPDLGEDASNYDEKSWVLGTSIIKVTTDRRTGWCKIDTIRPSGSSSMVAKLENVPIVGLGNDHADLVSLSAVLVGNQDPSLDGSGEDGEEQPGRESIAQTVLGSTSVSTPSNTASAGSFVWSGVAPSQRRKDVWVDPSFVASQFFVYPYESASILNTARLVTDAGSLRTIKNIDVNNPPVDIHKVAVLYVGAGQTQQEEILGNIDGSANYTRFLHNLGRVVKLRGQKDIPTGLDTSDEALHGTYTYAWWDDVSILAFHVATLMPNLPLSEGDRPYLNKSAPIGNDHVRVVFNDSGQDYAFDTLKTDFQFCNIVISPHTAGTSRTHDNPDEHNFFKVTIQRVEGLPEFGPVGQFKIVSAAALPSFIRLLSFMADTICKNYTAVMQGIENTTSWKNRLRLIDRIRDLAITRDPTIPTEPMSAIVTTSDFTRNL